MNKYELLEWLQGKLQEAEQALRSREEMSKPLQRISDEEWEQLKSLPGTRVTTGRRLSKAALKEMEMEPLRHQRIAIKCRREVAMFRATIDALSRPNRQGSGDPATARRKHSTR